MTAPGSIQIAPTARDIITQLRTVVHPFGIQVVDEFVGEGGDIGRLPDGQSIKPTAVLEFGEPATLSQYEDIVWTRGQLADFPFAVLALANDGEQLRVVRDCIVSALEGYSPVNCGEIRKLGSGPRVKVSAFLMPLRFAQTIGFAVPIGTTIGG